MRDTLTDQSKELLESSFLLSKALSQIFTPDLIDYICILVAKDGAHQKYLELTKEDPVEEAKLDDN